MCSREEFSALQAQHAREPFAHVSLADANTVLKQLRRGRTGANGVPLGDCARGLPGVDLTGVDAQEVWIWSGAARSPGFGWIDVFWMFQWKEWCAARTPEEDALLFGHQGILGFGVCPIPGTTDPLPGMLGPVWDLWARLDDGSVTYFHPSQKGSLLRVTDGSPEERAAAQHCVRHKGISEQVRALYPRLAPRGHREGPRVVFPGVLDGILLGGAVRHVWPPPLRLSRLLWPEGAAPAAPSAEPCGIGLAAAAPFGAAESAGHAAALLAAAAAETVPPAPFAPGPAPAGPPACSGAAVPRQWETSGRMCGSEGASAAAAVRESDVDWPHWSAVSAEDSAWPAVPRGEAASWYFAWTTPWRAWAMWCGFELEAVAGAFEAEFLGERYRLRGPPPQDGPWDPEVHWWERLRPWQASWWVGEWRSDSGARSSWQ